VGSGSKSRDVVLGARQLVGLFFVLVVVLGVAFTLGYLMGRSQFDSQLRAASGNAVGPHAPDARTAKIATAKTDKGDKSNATVSGRDAEPAPPSAAADWDFYHAGEPAKPAEKLSPPPAKSAKVLSATNRAGDGRGAASPALKQVSRSTSTPAAASGGASDGRSLNSPLIPRGATVLQVAALARQTDALALAQALQSKKFPAFVLAPDADNFYRVQVGPYTQLSAANAARQRLEDQGFKSIIKR